nr:glycosyltransferase family 2 protein [Bifidobacterium crudilactis]
MVLKDLPQTIPGIDEIEIMIVDDGCTDRTVEVAKELGVQHIVRHTTTRGLARAFRDGVDYALKHGADILVNTDGDNQYPSGRIPDLVAPIVKGEAEIVVGDRQTAQIKEFSAFKKSMQHLGSWVVNKAAGTHIPDAASGFRAYSRESLMRLNIVTDFSYCMETIIQAGNKRIAITSVPITTNPKTRDSRLFSNIFEHMAKSASAIIQCYLMYRARSVFKWASLIFGTLGSIFFIRYLALFAQGFGRGHLQSLILGLLLLMTAVMCLSLLIISEVQRTGRKLQEDQLQRTKEIMYNTALLNVWEDSKKTTDPALLSDHALSASPKTR